MFDARRIVAAAGESVVKVYDKTDGNQWDCGAGVGSGEGGSESVGLEGPAEASQLQGVAAVEGPEGYTTTKRASASIVERVRIKDGFMVEGRRDGVIGVWSC
jgi:division protein 1